MNDIKHFKKQEGFTLIELMIVIAIIGILAAVAIPAYQDYIGRAQMTEAITLAGGQKSSVAEHFMNNGTLAAVVGGSAIYTPTGTLAGRYVASIAATDIAAGQVVIAATMNAVGVNSSVASTVVRLSTKDGGSTWYCSSDATQAFLPSSCTGGIATAVAALALVP